jgi:hypothetical protein
MEAGTLFGWSPIWLGAMGALVVLALVGWLRGK